MTERAHRDSEATTESRKQLRQAATKLLSALAAAVTAATTFLVILPQTCTLQDTAETNVEKIDRTYLEIYQKVEVLTATALANAAEIHFLRQACGVHPDVKISRPPLSRVAEPMPRTPEEALKNGGEL